MQNCLETQNTMVVLEISKLLSAEEEEDEEKKKKDVRHCPKNVSHDIQLYLLSPSLSDPCQSGADH